MKNIIAFSGSNSSTSINSSLIHYTSSLVDWAKVEIIDLREYNIPMFSEDLEKEIGSPDAVKKLANKLIAADAVIVSTPEHNGMPPAFFKNILDWLSRSARVFLDGQAYLENTPFLLMSAGPGKGGAGSSRALVKNMFKHAQADFVDEFQLGSFYDNFSDGQLTNEELVVQLNHSLKQLEGKINKK